MPSSGFSTIIMEYAYELQRKELLVDVYLQPSQKEIGIYEIHRKKFNMHKVNILYTEHGFPAHKLLLASVSPFLKRLFDEHYIIHRDKLVVVLLPETSALALHHVLTFIYSSILDIPAFIVEDVKALCKILEITKILKFLDNQLKAPLNFKLNNEFSKKHKYNCNSPAGIITNHSVYECNSMEYHKNIMTMNQQESESPIESSNIKNVNMDIANHPNILSKNIYELSDMKTKKKKVQLHKTQHSTCQYMAFIPNITGNSHLQNSSPESLQNHLISDKKIKKPSFLLHSNIKQVQTCNPVSKLVPLSNSISEPNSVGDFTSSNSIIGPLPSHLGNQLCNLNRQQDSILCGHPNINTNLNIGHGEEERKLQVLLQECEGIIDTGIEIFQENVNDNENNTTKFDVIDVAANKLSTTVNEWIHEDSAYINVLICKKCHFKAVNIIDLQNHNLQQHKGKDFRCKICGKTFSRSNDCKIHELRHQKGNLPCSVCLKKFKIKKDLDTHLLIHSRSKYVECPECLKKLTSKRNLKVHVAKFHSTDLKCHECSFCDKKFKKLSSLQIHMRSIHTEEGKFAGKICRKKFADPGLLNANCAVRYKKANYNCLECQRSFARYASYWKHKKLHKSSFKCDSCGVTHETFTDFSKHKLLHKNRNLKSHVCGLCNHTFQSRITFDKHINANSCLLNAESTNDEFVDKNLHQNLNDNSNMNEKCKKNIYNEKYLTEEMHKSTISKSYLYPNSLSWEPNYLKSAMEQPSLESNNKTNSHKLEATYNEIHETLNNISSHSDDILQPQSTTISEFQDIRIDTRVLAQNCNKIKKPIIIKLLTVRRKVKNKHGNVEKIVNPNIQLRDWPLSNECSSSDSLSTSKEKYDRKENNNKLWIQAKMLKPYDGKHELPHIELMNSPLPTLIEAMSGTKPEQYYEDKAEIKINLDSKHSPEMCTADCYSSFSPNSILILKDNSLNFNEFENVDSFLS